jgi:hypothetical protein
VDTECFNFDAGLRGVQGLVSRLGDESLFLRSLQINEISKIFDVGKMKVLERDTHSIVRGRNTCNSKCERSLTRASILYGFLPMFDFFILAGAVRGRWFIIFHDNCKH